MIFWIVNCSIAFLICVFCAGIIIPQILLVRWTFIAFFFCLLILSVA